MIIRGVGGGDVLTSLTSTSLTLRNMYTLRMLSYDHEGGWGGVLTSLTSTSLTLRNKCTQKKYLGPTAGHGVTMSPCSLWLLRCHERSGTEASRRRKNWMSECRPDMIRMVENHRFLMFFDP